MIWRSSILYKLRGTVRASLRIFLEIAEIGLPDLPDRVGRAGKIKRASLRSAFAFFSSVTCRFFLTFQLYARHHDLYNMDDNVKKLLMARRSLAFYAHSHLSGPTAPPYNGKFIVSAHHKEWSQIVNQHPNLCINAPRDHGKCKPAGTLIQAADGRRVPIEMWTGGHVVSLNDTTLKLEIHTASPSVPNGKRECIYIRTATGRELVATANEPTRTFNGWVPLECVVRGTLIAAPRNLAVFGKRRDLGAWNSGFIFGTEHRNGNWQLPLDPNVLELTRADLIDWLSGYMDANLAFRGNTIDLGYVFGTDRDFLKEMQSILSRFGVISTLSFHAGMQGNSHGKRGWTLSIGGENLTKLSNTLKMRTPNGITLAHVGAKSQFSAGSKMYDIYPPEFRHCIKTSYYTLRAHLGFAPSKTAAMTRAQARKVASIETSDEFLRHYNADIFWDQVVEVRPLGKIPVFSVTVPGPENYVANDLITHNSYFFSLAYPIWSLDKKPGAKAMIFSATLDQAERLLSDIKTEIESNQALAHLRPKKEDKWAKRHVELGNGSVLYARGYGSKIRGFHPDIIVCDDVLNDEDGRSETQRQKNIDYFYSAITPALIPNGQMIVVGTPFSTHDLYGDLAKNPNFFFKRYPAIENFGSKNEIALWPDRYSLDMLKKKQANGSLRFSREYLCQPMSDDAALFPASLFSGEGVTLSHATLGMPLGQWRALGVETVYMGVDFGLSTRTGEDADSTVIWVCGVDRYKNRFIMDIFERDGMGFMEQKSWIEHYARKYRAGLIFVESNQAQRIFGDELIRTTDLPIKHFVTGAEKSSLEKGIPWLRTMLEQRKYRIPRGDEQTEAVINKWIDQMHNFTFDKGRIINTARHDDLAMACYICERAIVEGGFGFAFDADADDIAADQAEAALQREAEEKLAAGLDIYDDLPMITGNRKAGFHKVSDAAYANEVKLEPRSYDEVRPADQDIFYWPPGVPRPR
jgi:hypothetical protein